MKPSQFVGSTDPLEAEEWLSSIETILDFMRLNDQERVMCASYMLRKDVRHWWGIVKLRRNVNTMTWAEFVREFNQKYYNPAALRAQQNEFLNLKQGTMIVIQAVQKFKQLYQLCPFLANTEEERLRRMMDMFRSEIALAIDSGGGPPTSVVDCIERAIKVEYRLAQLKEERAKHWEAKKKQRRESTSGQVKGWYQGSKPNHKPNQSTSFKKKGKPSSQWGQGSQASKKNPPNFPPCPKCGKMHPRECRAENPNVCYHCGKEGHYAKQCPNPPNFCNTAI